MGRLAEVIQSIETQASALRVQVIEGIEGHLARMVENHRGGAAPEPGHPSGEENPLKRDLKGPALGVALGKLAITMLRDIYLFRAGEIDARNFRVRTGGNVGGSAGIFAGAAAGMACGALLPGVGTIIGAFAGGMFGSMSGQHLGRVLAEQLEPHIAAPAPEANEKVGDR